MVDETYANIAHQLKRAMCAGAGAVTVRVRDGAIQTVEYSESPRTQHDVDEALDLVRRMQQFGFGDVTISVGAGRISELTYHETHKVKHMR